MSVQQYYTTKASLTSKEKQDAKLIARALLERFSGNPYYAQARVVAGKVSYKPEREPLNEELLTLHLKGERTLGAYQLDKNNCVKFIAWDIDSDNPVIAKNVTKKIIEKLGDIPHCVELSGRKGYHVFIFLTSPIQASRAKQIAEAVRGDLPIAGAVHVEVFPKQVKLTKENPMGSLIKIPLCLHPLTKKRSRFIDTLADWENSPSLEPLPLLSALVEPSALEVLLVGAPPASNKPDESRFTPLGQPLTPGSRNENIFHQALQLERSGAPFELALKTLLPSEQPDFPVAEIEAAVRSAYKHAARAKEARGKAIGFCFDREHGDAEFFAELFRDQVVYDHATRAWYQWYGNYWEKDRTKEVEEKIANELADEYYRASVETDKSGNEDVKESAKALFKRAGELRTKRRIDSVLALAARIKGMKLSGDEWDTNPMILGVNNGVIDLVAGQFRTSNPKEYLRAHSPIDWLGVDYPAPIWKKFLLDITGDDQSMVDFMQRLFGYCITGKTTDHIFPILWGKKGFNGKGTLLETLAKVLGKDLAMPTPPETVMAKKNSGGGTNTALMAFEGKRLVWASESKEGQKIDSAVVKLNTGGDTISGNDKYEKQHSFAATHKLMLMTNDKPHINVDDQALLERIMLLDFQIHFCDNPQKENEKQIDKEMPEKLIAEASGILAWLVRGCLLWQAKGLQPTERVKAANDEYKKEEDTVGDFVLDCLIMNPAEKTLAADIYRRYKGWSIANGQNPMSATALNKRLEDKFGKQIRIKKGSAYAGIELLQAGEEWAGRAVDLER